MVQFLGSTSDSKTPMPSLSKEARLLLKEASIDKHGYVIRLRAIGGTFLQTNGKNLITSNECREVAKWEGALNELVNQNLLEARGHKGETFAVTNRGYQIADMIEL